MSWYPSPGWGARAVRFFWFVTAGSQEDHGMNRCLRSLSCVLTLSALALFSTEATARTNAKPKPASKSHEAKTPAAKTPGAKATHAAKEARPHRSAAAGKHRPARHAHPRRESQ